MNNPNSAKSFWRPGKVAAYALIMSSVFLGCKETGSVKAKPEGHAQGAANAPANDATSDSASPSQAAQVSHDDSSALEFVAAIYREYRLNHEFDNLGKDADTLFAPDLLGLIREDAEQAKGEVGFPDWDPICDCQDYDITHVRTGLRKAEHSLVKANVHFLNFGKPDEITLSLMRTGTVWRIADIQSPSRSSLVVALREYLSWASFEVDTTAAIPDLLRAAIKGAVQQKFRFHDKAGIHLLILSRDSTELKDGTDEYTLKAAQYALQGSAWNREWVIQDFLSCYEVDRVAEFLPHLTAFSDLDSNGVAETAVAYQTACFGDVSPRSTKAILRQGDAKFAVRGDSRVQVGAEEYDGGIPQTDAALDAHPAFKSYLASIWERAAGVE